MNASQINSGWSMEQPGETHGGVFGLVHRLLRGRYLLTLVLAGVCAAIGGITGFVIQEPLYRSVSVIKVEASLPKILYETEQASAPRMFSSFVNTQAQLMQSNDVIERAMASDRWRSVAAISGVVTVDQFKAGLRVSTNRAAQELIYVSYEHADARVAQVANEAVVEAYMGKHGSQGRLDSERTMGVLQTRRETLRREKDKIDSQIRQIVERRGTDKISELLSRTVESAMALEAQKETLEAQRAELERIKSGGDGSGAAEVMTEERAALLDPGVKELIQLRAALESQRAELLASGVLRGHRLFKQVEAGLTQVNAQIDERIGVLRDSILRGEHSSTGESGMTLDEIDRQLASVSERLAEQERRRSEIFKDDLAVRDLYRQREDVEKDIAFVEARITALETESQVADFSEVSGRISVASEANLPKVPSSDKRIKLAGAGFVFGGAVPVGAMLLLGMMGRRIRFSDDGILESAHSRIVGVLPDLGNALSDRELAEASAFAVHQIRSQLQILYGGKAGGVVFSVTSPAPGDGKTSLIIALGLSFAESGDRTLLIDLDLIGRGLSLHFGFPDAPSLADAAAVGDDLPAMVRQTSFDRLSVLPAGFGDDMRISKLSPPVVRRLVETFRDQYDTILIDSGPILGSIEAGLLAPATDGMLMVVGRGQLRPLVKRAVDQIQAVGGQVIATVFNRASVAELRQSSSSMSVHFSRQASRQAVEQAARGGPGVGPLAGSLFSSKQSSGEQG
ncbi:MAG: hypothetical protein D6692_10955 [Planctomycetota bacterium]|nr:MAG: hypothetical protein D6692_10955 [Planctomycetota bacterium]